MLARRGNAGCDQEQEASATAAASTTTAAIRLAIFTGRNAEHELTFGNDCAVDSRTHGELH